MLAVAATMAAVFMPITLPMVMVMGAGEISGKFQRSVEVAGHDRIDRALHAGNQLDSLLGERLLRPRADAAANQQIDTQIPQKSGQSAVPGISGRQHTLPPDNSPFNLVHGEFRRMTEMLKHLSVLTGNCNQHSLISPVFNGNGPNHPIQAVWSFLIMPESELFRLRFRLTHRLRLMIANLRPERRKLRVDLQQRRIE